MKNRIHTAIILFALVFSLQSCFDEFLEVEPKVNDLDANAYKTEEDAMEALIAVYNTLAVQPWNYVPIQSDIFSDDAFCAGEPGGGMWQWQDQEIGIIDPENAASSDLWNKCYSGNYRANMFFDKESGIVWETPGLRERMHAEVLVLRAYFYWDLVRHFGWVPLIPYLIPNTEDYKSIPQSSPEEMYSFIVEDLLLAIPDLPLTVPANEKGRITKDVARVLLARIYLYYEGFAKPVMGISNDLSDGVTVIDKAYVQQLLEEIIGSNRYRLLTEYADVFDWGNENNAESIFEFQYSNGANSDDWGGWNISGNFSVVFYGPRDPVGDPDVATGWSFATVTWSLVDEFEEGDPRLDQTAYNANVNLTSYTRAYQNTGYFNYKYMPRSEYRHTGSGVVDHNWPINYKDMRYAEVLLIAAELFLEDDNAKATGYLNEVRTRAMGDGAALSSITLDDIYHERRVELGGEGHRKWDLLRRGLTYAKENIDASWVIPDSADSPNDFLNRQFVIDTWGMLPIPASEIRLANEGVLQQYVPAFK